MERIGRLKVKFIFDIINIHLEIKHQSCNISSRMSTTEASVETLFNAYSFSSEKAENDK